MEASSASSSSIGELVKEEAVWILSEWQQVQRAIVQLTAVTNSIRNQLSEKCTYIQCVLVKNTNCGSYAVRFLLERTVEAIFSPGH